MKYRTIRYEPAAVARIIMNRPLYRNAQSRLMLEEMDDAFVRAGHDAAVKVIVLSGAGDHFSSGHDLGTPDELADRQQRGFPTDVRDFYSRARALFFENALSWRNLPKPTIAMVQGYCIYGGWIIAAAMDLIFASADALFLPSHLQYFSPPWDIGPKKAKEVLFENRFISAKEARELGFVNRVFTQARLEKETLEFAARIAQQDPFVLKMQKFSVNHMLDTMGFTASVNAAFQTYYVNRALGWENFEKKVSKSKKLADSSSALENLKIKERTEEY